MEIKNDVELAEFTSWLVGGRADFFAVPSTMDELKTAWKWGIDSNLPVTFFGGGTNILISDQGIRGLTICLRRFSQSVVSTEGHHLRISCLAGTAKSEILKIFLRHKLAPALFLAGLPGDVGGGIVMNAGVAESFQPREFGEIVENFEVLNFDGSEFKTRIFHHDDVNWAYRHSSGWEPGIVVRAEIKWPLVPDPSILEKVKAANLTRLSKQPLDMPSCGSVFKNPEGKKAAQLIDACGLKGARIGDAQVSLKHANFIVNLGKAKAIDIWNLIQLIQKTVLEKMQVSLRTEVVRMGDWP
jgi:UDP-N-acetylmuramate dehydrogenase